MEKLIIGSTAMKHWFPKDYPREPKDLDIIVRNPSKFKKEKGVEYLENPILLKYENEGYITPDMLLTLKMSHMFWDFNWKKHMWDIQFLLDKGCNYKSDILEEFIQYWNDTKPKIKRSVLNQSAKNFFTNAVNKDEKEHDFLHTLINPVPMYTRLLKDNCEVELDENKWHKLSFEEKCDVVFEETAVMTYERYKNKYYKIGYEIQLEQNVIKHFPKYIAIFTILNYKKLVTPKYNFIEKINNNLKQK